MQQLIYLAARRWMHRRMQFLLRSPRESRRCYPRDGFSLQSIHISPIGFGGSLSSQIKAMHTWRPHPPRDHPRLCHGSQFLPNIKLRSFTIDLETHPCGIDADRGMETFAFLHSPSPFSDPRDFPPAPTHPTISHYKRLQIQPDYYARASVRPDPCGHRPRSVFPSGVV